jgi:hypothetical protein
MKKMVLAVLVGLALAGPAMAQTAPAGGPDDGCRQKIEQLCPGVKPGGGRIKACIEQHNTTLAALCPERAAMHKERNGSSQPGTTVPSQAPVATPGGVQ